MDLQPFLEHDLGIMPALSRTQMLEVERLLAHDYGIEPLQMIENAGRCLAVLARARFLAGDPRGREVIILAGGGTNGGAGMVAARHLSNWGAHVEVLLAGLPERATVATMAQQRILEAMAVTCRAPEALEARLRQRGTPALIVDALIGYRLRLSTPGGGPIGPTAMLIQWARGAGCPVLALDLPSGLDVDDGSAHDPTIVADATMTLGLPKRGLLAVGAERYVGELYLADISVPPQLYANPAVGVTTPPGLFARAGLLRLRPRA